MAECMREVCFCDDLACSRGICTGWMLILYTNHATQWGGRVSMATNVPILNFGIIRDRCLLQIYRAELCFEVLEAAQFSISEL
jgi:hypothetical protein